MADLFNDETNHYRSEVLDHDAFKESMNLSFIETISVKVTPQMVKQRLGGLQSTLVTVSACLGVSFLFLFVSIGDGKKQHYACFWPKTA